MNKSAFKTQIVILPNMKYYYIYNYSKTWPQKIVFTQRTWPSPLHSSNVDPYEDFQFFFDLIKLIENITQSKAKYCSYKIGNNIKKERITNIREYEMEIFKKKEKDRFFPDEIVFEDKGKQKSLIMCILDFGGPGWHYDSLAYALYFKNSSWKNILMAEGLKMNSDRYKISVDEGDYAPFFEKLKRKVIFTLKNFLKM